MCRKRKNRECPHCHQTVSLWRCVDYKLYDGGKEYRTRCNHCGRHITIKRTSLNFWGFLLVWFIPYILVQGLLYFLEDNLPFWVVPTAYLVLLVITAWLWVHYVARKIEFDNPQENE